MLLRGAVRGVLPRWWVASPASLAVARLAVVWVAAGVQHPLTSALAAGHSGDARQIGLSRALPIVWPSPTTFGHVHVWALRVALWLALLGVASPVSLTAAALLLIRCRAAQIAMYGDGGHSEDLIGPVLLLLAGSPCADTLSVDALVASVRKAWGSSPAIEAGGGLTGAVMAASRGWAQGLSEDCRRCSRAYSAPLVFAAMYIGLFYLSSGLIKANTGSPFIWGWAKAGFLRSNLVVMWLRRWGEPRLPSLRQVLTNPLQAACETYFLPALRVDRVPALLEVGGAAVVGWECMHWFLMLCGPWVRTLSVLLAVSFHLLVSFSMGISFYPLAALQVALLTPWGVLLDRLVLARWLAQKEPGGKGDGKIGSMSAPAPGLRQRPLVWLTVAVGLLLVVGQSLVAVKSVHLRNAPYHTRNYPFDQGPTFNSHGQANPTGNGTYTLKSAASRLLARHMVLHLEGGGPPVRYPVWQAVCIVGGYKEECMLRRQGTVSYWCCQYGKKAYPDDLMRTFAYDPHRLGAQISPQQFRKLGMMALDERSLLPAAETRSVAAVSFETTPSLKIHMQLSVAEIMARAQPQMECEELVMRPGTDEGSANVTRTCQQKQQPAKKPGNRAKQISPAKKDRAAMAPKALALRNGSDNKL
eukprot:jgi/Tetstr1/455647/TSEL_042458.t1